MLFSVGATDLGWFAAVGSLETGEHRRLFPASGRVRFLPPNHLVYGQGGGLWAVPFDLENLEVRGAARPVMDNVLSHPYANTQQEHFAISETGTLTYLPGGIVHLSPVWVDRDGRRTAITQQSGPSLYPKLSPDGNRLAASQGDIWIYDLEGGTRTRLATEGDSFVPRWSPDGERLVFGSFGADNQTKSLYELRVDGQAQGRFLEDSPSQNRQYPIAWTPDGHELLVFELDPETSGNILVWTPADGEMRPLIATAFNEWSASLSTDGRFLAYSSNATGRDEVYVTPYPTLERTVPISTEGGSAPLWSRDGRDLFYRIGSRVMVVDVIDGPTISVTSPRVLFKGNFWPEACCELNYDISPDGKRFVMVREPVDLDRSRIHVITNWNELVAQTDPGGN